MNRQCLVNQIVDDIKLNIIGVGRTSATSIKPLQVLLPVGGFNGKNESLANKNNTYQWARSIQRQANEKYQSKIYGNIVEIDTRPANGTIVNITVPSKLIDAYERKYGKQTTMFSLDTNKVQYALKASNILSSDKAIEWFKKRDKGQWKGDIFWQKLQQDLQIPKEQIEILKGLELDNPYNREELLTSLLANYSYTVEVETKMGDKDGDRTDSWFEDKDWFYYFDGEDSKYYRHKVVDNIVTDKSVITQEEYYTKLREYLKTPTQFYSNMTVPGGTNYTENEIKTPAITPSIKGHAQFSTNNGIGWFRSDDKQRSISEKEYFIKINKDHYTELYFNGKLVHTVNGEVSLKEALEDAGNPDYLKGTEAITKTRRILEVQSDLFQKGRNMTDFITKEEEYEQTGTTYDEQGNPSPVYTLTGKSLANSNSNKFLQLLNKDNNWVTFFVKSIVQDSAKKGYEKVVFPTGNTASKIEGHTTLEEFKKEKESRLKKLKTELSDLKEDKKPVWVQYNYEVPGDEDNPGGVIKVLKHEDEIINIEVMSYEDGQYDRINIDDIPISIKNIIDNTKPIIQTSGIKGIPGGGGSRSREEIQSEIDQINRELERVEKEGFAALRPIYKFYEETVGNILKKTYKDIKRVKDEYGNEWYEINIDKSRDISDIYFQVKKTSTVRKKKELTDKVNSLLGEYIKQNGIKVEFLDSLKDEYSNDPIALYDSINKVIKINTNKADVSTLPEELGHHLSLALGKDHTLVKRALNLIGRLNYREELGEDYVTAYKDNTELMKFEYLGKLISKRIVDKLDPPRNENEYKLWNTIVDIINKFISLFKANDNITNELDKVTSELAEMITSGTKVNNSKSKMIMYQLDETSKDNNLPIFHTKFLEGNDKLGTGKRFSVRPIKYKTGNYKIGESYYNIILLTEKPQLISEVKNPDFLKRKSIGDEEIKYEHIKDFYDNKLSMYVYQIQKINETITNEIKESVVNNKKAIETSTRQVKEKKQEIYFKRLLKNLGKQNKDYNRQLLLDKNNQALKDKIKTNQDRINTIKATLDEYSESKNRQLLVALADDTLSRIEEYVKNLNPSSLNKTNIVDDIEHTVNTINIFKELTGTQDRASRLYERLKPFIIKYNLELVNQFSSKEVTELDIDTDAKDIFVGGKNFGTLSDITNHLGKTIGLIIKDAQQRVTKDNKKSYEDIKKHIDVLEKWAEKNNIPKKDMYNVFIQDNGNTTVLTREYTTDFYRFLIDTKKLPDKERLAARKKVATYNFDQEKWIPKDNKYINKNYKKIQKTPELKQFYNFFKETIASISEELPINLRENFIPNIAEQTLMDIMKSDKSVAQKFKDSIANITEVYDHNVKEDAKVNDENLLVDDIPLKYIGSLSKDIKSTDLGNSLLTFMYFANNYKHMSEVLPKTRLLQEEIKERKFLKNTDDTTTITGDKTNIFSMADAYIEMQVKGNKKKEEKLGNFEYAKYIDFGLKYTSLLRIGLNPFNAVTNVIVGRVGNLVEAWGGRYFTRKEYVKAERIFRDSLVKKDSKVDKIVAKYNPLMELEDYENLSKVRVGLNERKEKFKNSFYYLQKIGEKYLQTSTMIASMLHDKVETKDGNKISLWEAFDEKGEWKEDLMGYKLTDEMVFKTTNKIQRINQMIHGRYSQKDAATLSQYALFRAAFQFKKWIPAAIESRFQSKRFDDRLGFEIEGRYRTLRDKVVKNIFSGNLKGAMDALIQPLFNQVKALESGKYTETEVYNMRKNAIELIIIMASVLMYAGLDTDDDKLKRNGWYKFLMSQLNKTSGDLMYWYDLDELSKSATNVVPLAKSIRDIIKVGKNIPYVFGIEGSEYESGPRAGENKFLASGIDVLPVAKPLADVIRNFNNEKYKEFVSP